MNPVSQHWKQATKTRTGGVKAVPLWLIALILLAGVTALGIGLGLTHEIATAPGMSSALTTMLMTNPVKGVPAVLLLIGVLSGIIVGGLYITAQGLRLLYWEIVP